VLDAEEASHALFSAPLLREVVAALAQFCERSGHSVIYGASPAGQALAGALFFAHPNAELWRPGAERVLIVDGVLAGLDGIGLAAEHLRCFGARDLDACVVGLLSEEPPQPVGVRELEILGSTAMLTDVSLAA
jgi:hypothetical protein